MIELRDVTYRAGSVTILDGVSVRFRPNRFNVIAGANGAGKSTLLRMAAGLARATAGEVLYGSRNIADISMLELARTRAVLSQHTDLAFPLTVQDVVLIGRHAHYEAAPTQHDLDIVGEALAAAGMIAMRGRDYTTLSGGEQQKVQLARVLAQLWSRGDRSGKVLFLDEPTTNLDLLHQLQLLSLARTLLAGHCTIIAVLHDLNVALEYGDAFMLMDSGRIVLDTDDHSAVDESVIERVFHVRASRIIGATARESVWRFSI